MGENLNRLACRNNADFAQACDLSEYLQEWSRRCRCRRRDAETGQVGEPFQRYVVGHFEDEEKISRHLLDQSPQIFGGRTLVVGSINADRLEHLSVFNKAAPLESGLGKFPSEAVTLLVVDDQEDINQQTPTPFSYLSGGNGAVGYPFSLKNQWQRQWQAPGQTMMLSIKSSPGE